MRRGLSANHWRPPRSSGNWSPSSTTSSGNAWTPCAIDDFSRNCGTAARRRGTRLNRTDMYDFAIIGGGIVGLSVGMHLTERYEHARVLLIEKEDHWAAHQTGHNSGVIHSGIYYKPGSFK